MRKPYKIIEQENGSISLIGNHHWKEIEYQVPEWNEDEDNPDVEACFKYLGRTYFLSEFMRVNDFDFFKGLGFHGHLSDSFFSGVLIKYSHCNEAVQVSTYIS